MKKRPALERHMYDRGPRGYWHRRWVPDKAHARGGRDKWTFLSKDLEEATRRYHQLEAEKPREVEAGTVGALATRWLHTYVSAFRDEKGQALAARRVQTYLTPGLGHLAASKVTEDDLLRYRTFLRSYKHPETKRRLKEQSIIHLLADAKCLFLWAKLPVPRRLVPKPPEVRPRGLTKEEQERVRAVEPPFGLAARILLESGARWSELCRLRSNDVIDGELHIDGFTAPTKSRKARAVPISSELVAELKGHIGRLVLFEQKDNPSFNRSVRLRSGVESFSAHACRHSFAYNLLADGWSLLAIKIAMGHSTLTVTQRYLPSGQDFVRQEARRASGWSGGA